MSLGLGLGIGLFKGVGSLAAVGKRVIGESVVLNDLTPTFTRANPVATDPVTGLQTKHNLCLQSQTFDNASWVKAGLAATPVIADSAVAPDGTMTADKIVEDGALGTHYVTQVPSSLTSSITYTFSVYVKSAGRIQAQLRVLNKDNIVCRIFVDLNTGNIRSTSNILASSERAVYAENGWWRFSFSFDSGSGATTPQVYQFMEVLGANTYQGDGTSGIYLWGAQLNRGAAATEYVPTTTTATDGSGVRRRLPLALPGKSVLADLIEGSRANLQVYSQAFTPTWSGSLFSLAAAPGLAPDGTATATRLTFSNLNSYFGCSAACTAGTPNTRSIYYRRVDNDWAYIIAYYDASNRATLWVNLATGQKGQQTTQGTASISATDVVAVGGGWYRVSLTSQHASLGTPTLNIGHCSGDGVATSTAGNSVDIWGAQVELGSFPSSYIPTTTVAVTRSADSLSVSLSSLVDSRTNLCPYSENWQGVNWTKTNAAVDGGANAAPNGTSTATLITSAAGVGYHYAYSANITVVQGNQYTVSAYVKQGTAPKVMVGDRADSAWHDVVLDFATGTITNQFTATGTVTNIGGGWYRVTCTFTKITGTTVNLFIAPVNADISTPSYNAAGTETVLAWGAQCNDGAVALEYLPTAASAITTGPTGLSLDRGTLVAVCVPLGDPATAGTLQWAYVLDGGSSQSGYIWSTATNVRVYKKDAGTVAAVNLAATVPPKRSVSTLAMVYSSAGLAAYDNGAVIGTSSANLGMPYTVGASTFIGSDNAAAGHVFGYVALLYWPRALTAGEIAALQTVIGQGVTLAL